MIIKGKSRSAPSKLAAHLGNAEDNERVELLEARGTVAQDLRGALIELDAYADGTRCEKPLYHAAVSPEPPYRLTPEQREEAIDALEERLGLSGHQRVVVLHEKYGREHFHIVWTRIDLLQLKSISDSHNYRKHEEVARDLERRFGHERVQGAHHERDGVDRPDRTPSRAELRQEERTGIKGKDVKAEVTAAFRQVDDPKNFKLALEDAGYILAKGDKRDFVIVDRAGGVHSLARRIDGMKAPQLREFMSALDRDALPNVEQAREIIDEREKQREALHDDALAEKAYGRGDDYVSQTTAARKDHEHRQDILDERYERYLESEMEEEQEVEIAKDDDAERTRRAAAQEITAPEATADLGEEFSNREMTDEQRARIERLLNTDERSNRQSDDPDRQPEAPGGGRTRSQ